MVEKVICKYCAEEIYINVDYIDGYHKKSKRLHDETILNLCEPPTRDLLKRIKNKIQLHGLYEEESVVFIEKSNPSEKERKELHIILEPDKTNEDGQELKKIRSITPFNIEDEFLEWFQVQIKVTIQEMDIRKSLAKF